VIFNINDHDNNNNDDDDDDHVQSRVLDPAACVCRLVVVGNEYILHSISICLKRYPFVVAIIVVVIAVSVCVHSFHTHTHTHMWCTLCVCVHNRNVQNVYHFILFWTTFF